MNHQEMIPLFIDPNNLKTIFYGGGRVALRKAIHLKNCKISVVSKSIRPELKKLAFEIKEIEINEESLGLMDQFQVVIAATDDKLINEHIVSIAKAKGKFVNSVDGGGNFIIPSMYRRPSFVVCVSTEGRIPVYPPFLIEKINEAFGETYDEMGSLLQNIRPRCIEEMTSQKERAAFLNLVVRSPGIWEQLQDKTNEISYERCREILEW